MTVTVPQATANRVVAGGSQVWGAEVAWPYAAAPMAPSIRVDPEAAFQLAVFAEDERVRDAAAESLWPREYVERCDIEANDCDFAEVPFAERVAALIVASSICLHPNQAMRHRVSPLHQFLVPERRIGKPRRYFRIGASPRRGRVVRPTGREEAWRHAAVFRLPESIRETTVNITNWAVSGREIYFGECVWRIDERTMSLSIPRLVRSRAKTSAGGVHLVDHDGSIVPSFEGLARAMVLDGRIELDPSLLLRLESGGLAGAFLSFKNTLPSIWFRQPPDATLSLEIGPSLDAPVVMRTVTGDPSPRYDVISVVGRGMRSIPAFEGATVAALAQVARLVGVWQGGFLRASFDHHPLRARDAAGSIDEGASNGAAAAIAAREVA